MNRPKRYLIHLIKNKRYFVFLSNFIGKFSSMFSMLFLAFSSCLFYNNFTGIPIISNGSILPSVVKGELDEKEELNKQ